MFALGPLGLVVIVLFLFVVLPLVVITVVRSLQPRVTPTREIRLVTLTRALGVGLGIVAAVVVASAGSYGRGPMLAPAVFGLCVVAGVVLGETVVRPARAVGPRSASLRPRRLTDYLPFATTVMVGTLVVLTVALLVFTTATADRDPGTDTARALSCENATVGQSHSPYPGAYYSVPLALLLLLVLALAALAAQRVLLRPRGLVPDEVGDDALRRRSLDVIVSAVGIAVSAPYTGLAGVTSIALHGLATATPSCAPGWMSTVALLIALSMVLALVTGLVCLVRMLAGSPVQRSPHEAGAPR